MGVIDRLFPGFALKREVASIQLENVRRQRAALEKASNRYAGAGRDRRGSAWRADDWMPQDEAAISLPVLVRRGRDLWKNNPYGRKAVSLVATEAVGAGIECKLIGRRGTARAVELVKEWMKSPTCDWYGRLNWYAMQAMLSRVMVRDGAVLIKKIIEREPRSGIPIRLQALTIDWLSRDKDGPVKDGGFILHGIRYDAKGQRVSYIFYTGHERASATGLGTGNVNGLTGLGLADTVEVPASDVIHLYRTDEPGQEHGIPWLAPAFWTLRHLEIYEDAQLIRQQIAASVAVVRTTTGGQDLVAGEVGPDGRPRPKTERFEPGQIVRLTAGEDLKYLNPPTVEGYADVAVFSLRKIAAACELSYVALTGDYSDANYSAARMDHHFMSRMLDCLQWHTLVPHALDGTLRWVLEVMGLSPGTVTAEYTPPRRELLDPSKEVPPMIQKVRGGLASRSEAVRSLGGDPEQVDAEQAEDNRRADELGLSYDSDGRRPLNGTAPGTDTGSSGQTDQSDQTGNQRRARRG